MTQGVVLALLGAAVLRISVFSSAYLNYVRPGFRPFLIAAGVVACALGVTALVREWRRPMPPAHEQQGEAHGHDHARGPLVAWLLCLPVITIFLIAPPELGAFAAGLDDRPAPPPPAAESYPELAGTAPADMPVSEFVGRAWSGDSLAGRTVRLTGFVVPAAHSGQWYLTRMRMSCCAADAIAMKVMVLGAQAPPRNTWVEVTGTWSPSGAGGTAPPRLTAVKVTRVPRPTEPYE